jgi:hypothetical protein
MKWVLLIALFSACTKAPQKTYATELEERCMNNDMTACWNIAQLIGTSNGKKKEMYLRVCDRAKDEHACAKAADLIEAPAEVQRYVDGEACCKHWGGEFGGSPDKDRNEGIANGAKECCIDRSRELGQLKKKYKNEKEILFKLEHITIY